MQNKIIQLFNIKYPIIQAGMVWCSGWELASAASNAGALGLIGSGSMYPDVLSHHIKKCKQATKKPFGVNIPLLYPDIDQHIEIILKEKVKIVFTSAGNPDTWTNILKKNGVIVVHVVANVKFAKKARNSGVDALVAEGFEAGGHNGIDELTTLCLTPLIKKQINLPLIAAGGIGNGSSMLATMALGADGVQIGSRFAASIESSAHMDFKKSITEAKENSTILTLKELIPVRLIKNKFYEKVLSAYKKRASKEELKNLLGKGRAKRGMFEGDIDEGELEIGQVSAQINSVKPVKQIVNDIIKEFREIQSHIASIKM